MLLLILACVSLGLSEDAPVAAPAHEVAGWTLGMVFTPVLYAWLVFRARWLGRIDRLGDGRAVVRAETQFVRSRTASVIGFVAGAALLGWARTVRAWTGDLVLIDDLLALSPLVLALTLSWAAQYRLERRLLEAALLGAVDSGRPIHTIPTRAAYVWGCLRAQVGFVLAPVLAIMGATEALQRLPGAMTDRGPAPWLALAQLGAALCVFTLAPTVMVWMWNTVELGGGAVHESIDRQLRAWRVGVRKTLVWRTGGRMANGAIVGFLRPARYLLLSDALIERLPRAQLAAVCAHEIAHVRHRHMVWLASAVVGSLLLGGGLSALGLNVWLARTDQAWGEEWATVLVTGCAMGLAFLVFGWVSRAFEREADAFAARALSERPGDAGFESEPAQTITPEAAGAMSAALGAVARLNRTPEARFTWRHGSIAARRRALDKAVGRPTRKTPAGRTAHLARALSGLVLAAGIAVAALGTGMSVS